jgi:hypothetical protein
MASNVKVSRNLPTALSDAAETGMRGSRFGELLNQPLFGSRQALVDEGSYWIATNPTPDTGIALTTSITAFAETAGAVSVALHMRNSETTDVVGTKRIYPDYLRLKLIAQAPTSATSWSYAVTLNDLTTSYTSGGSTITPINANPEKASSGTIAVLHFGALTTAVPTNRRLVARGLLRGQVPVILDQYILVFGGEPTGGSYWVTAAGVQRIVEITPPFIIPPGWSMALHMWGASNAAAPQFEFESGWWEK